jgi:hypothetical protein
VPENLQSKLEETSKLYPRSKCPSWIGNTREETQANLDAYDFDHLFSQVVKIESSPGLPYNALATTNAEVLKRYSDFIKTMIKDRIMSYFYYDLSTMTSPYECDYGYTIKNAIGRLMADPVRVFVKQEPHNELKIQQQRYRLISSITIVDQCIERLLFSNQNEQEISSWKTIPSKPGIGFSEDDTLFEIAAELHSIPDACQTDVSGWDWSVQEWEMFASTKQRIMLADCKCQNQRDIMEHLMMVRTCLNVCSIFAFSDGELVVLDYKGVQKSGSYLTSSDNSRDRVLAHYLIGGTKAVAMGDDCVETYVPDAIEKYLELGHRMKDYSKVQPGANIEFCSHEFPPPHTRQKAYPINWDKSLYRLLSQPVALRNETILQQYQMENRNLPGGDLVTQYVIDSNWLRR